jgi:hypothetical protein
VSKWVNFVIIKFNQLDIDTDCLIVSADTNVNVLRKIPFTEIMLIRTQLIYSFLQKKCYLELTRKCLNLLFTSVRYYHGFGTLSLRPG